MEGSGAGTKVTAAITAAIYFALTRYCIVWRWRSPGGHLVKIYWTIFCLLVPFGAILMLVTSRPTPPSVVLPEIPSMPGTSLAALSAMAISASLFFGVIAGGLASQERAGVLSSSLGAVGLLLFGGYGITRARRILKQHASPPPRHHTPT